MSYQVLARKWRPRTFDEMVGQEHVLKALVNGLDNGRLHHAYLFTGTRGVGKTTLARIIAKCLNCEQGISSTPCGECGACKAIAEGRFVDLLEVDAASRTKVEDTRDLLDNVQYLPTTGRYKVYLIDEVHMLSNHSFNALLKTLEEPPPHVKFLLATTDPQKLPVTVLSRCLQFNLKNLGPERIVSHLRFVLGEEKVPFEEEALWALGRAADGSMRDALSLTDQAIAHGGGQVTQAEVNAMLGTIDRAEVVELCELVALGDAEATLAVARQLADHGPDYDEALGEMLSFWHRIAIAQTAPDALDHSHADHQRVLHLAARLDREAVQLFYQITLLGRRDLPHAADPRSGFEMVLLRLLAFNPVLPETRGDRPMPRGEPTAAATKASGSSQAPVATVPSAADRPPQGGGGAASLATAQEPRQAPPPEPVVEAANPIVEEPSPTPSRGGGPRLTLVKSIPDDKGALDEQGGLDEQGALDEEGVSAVGAGSARQETGVAHDMPADDRQQAGKVKERVVEQVRVIGERDLPPLPEREPPPRVALATLRPGNWLDVYLGLEVGGLVQNIAANLHLDQVQGARLSMTLDRSASSLYREEHQQRLAESLSRYFGEQVQVSIAVGEAAGETPWQALQRRRAERLREAVDSLRRDPLVRGLIEHTGGELLETSVLPLD